MIGQAGFEMAVPGCHFMAMAPLRQRPRFAKQTSPRGAGFTGGSGPAAVTASTAEVRGPALTVRR